MQTRRAVPWMVAGFLVSAAAAALTTPMGGAVLFPRAVRLTLPFPQGTRVRVLSGYGPAGGSSLHDGTNRTAAANDYYALDLVVDGAPNSGLGTPIVTPLAGTVVRAGWATAGWANYGLRVILRHDLGDGRVYHSIYCHLDALDPGVTEGGTVRAGQTLGTLGRSCQGARSCGSFSTPHLHWAVHRDSAVGGSGTGGSYGGLAVVPEPLDGQENLSRNAVYTSTTGSTGTGPRCGDGRCDAGETAQSCASDCRPACAPIGPAGRVVEESDPCFSRFGNAQYWYSAAAGSGGALLWTHCTADPSPDNYGVWSLRPERAGDYTVDVYTDGAYALSRRAVYQLSHAGRIDRVPLDQSQRAGWQRLGTFAFSTAAGQQLRLDDNTGEAFSARVRIGFDAVRVLPASPPLDAGVRLDAATPPDTGNPTPDTGTRPDTGVRSDTGVRPDTGVRLDAGPPAPDLPTAVDVDHPEDTGPPPDAGVDAGASRDIVNLPDIPLPDDTGEGTDAGPLHETDDGGCACRAGSRTPRRGNAAPLALGFLGWLLRRRRRGESSTA